LSKWGNIGRVCGKHSWYSGEIKNLGVLIMGIFDKFFGPNIDVEEIYLRRDVKGLLKSLDEGNTKARSLTIDYIGKILGYYENKSESEFNEFLVGQYNSEDLINIIMEHDLPLYLVDNLNKSALIKQGIYLSLLEHLVFDYSFNDVRKKCKIVLLNSSKIKQDFDGIWKKILDGDFSNLTDLEFPFTVVCKLPRLDWDMMMMVNYRENCKIFGRKRPWSYGKIDLQSVFGIDYNLK